MTVRKILSARTARPKVEGMLQALVEAAVFIGGADGRFGEEELDVFIDSMREVVSAAVGDEFLDSMASTSKLLDQARQARKELLARGGTAFLLQLVPKFPGAFARDGLVLAYRVVLADGKVTEKEAQAFEALASALGVEVSEVQVLKELATKAEHASKQGHRGASIEQLGKLVEHGWTKLPAGQEHGFDVGMEHVQATGGGKLTLELDSAESVLHVHVFDSTGKGPHLVCLFGDALPALVAVLDGLRDTLTVATLGEKLPAIRAVCPEVFVEHEGKFARL
jgi:tellurite resistance protein